MRTLTGCLLTLGLAFSNSVCAAEKPAAKQPDGSGAAAQEARCVGGQGRAAFTFLFKGCRMGRILCSR